MRPVSPPGMPKTNWMPASSRTRTTACATSISASIIDSRLAEVVVNHLALADDPSGDPGTDMLGNEGLHRSVAARGVRRRRGVPQPNEHALAISRVQREVAAVSGLFGEHALHLLNDVQARRVLRIEGIPPNFGVHVRPSSGSSDLSEQESYTPTR